MLRHGKKVRVLIIDDSAIVRDALSNIISKHPALEVAGTANDPFEAAEEIRKAVPDVITLDIEMPKMDGLTFLKRLMSQKPIPVIVCSSLVGKGSNALIQAMECGAVDIIQKPNVSTKKFLEDSTIMIQDKVLAAHETKSVQRSIRSKENSERVFDKARQFKNTGRKRSLIAVGASTGGTEAIRFLLGKMPKGCPPLVIVQHMPANFTMAFAKHLDSSCSISVKEASQGDVLERGTAYIAPGDKHLALMRAGSGFGLRVADGPLVSRHRPSVDVLFGSTAELVGSDAIGVILTGMGRDGASGLKSMKNAGALTIGQDESSCVVYGMSRVAYAEGAVEHELNLSEIPNFILCHVSSPG